MNAGTIIPLQPVGKLLPLIPASDLASLIAAGLELGRNKQEILERIDSNYDSLALRKKKERCEDQAWLMSRGTSFSGFVSIESCAEELTTYEANFSKNRLLIISFASSRSEKPVRKY
ncbi:MAG: hypothetical protein H7318_00300 [Oligoflexus sp.]|nr:hypothetical protein [Oligoflexus sp.]